jgi:hypothetical protein
MKWWGENRGRNIIHEILPPPVSGLVGGLALAPIAVSWEDIGSLKWCGSPRTPRAKHHDNPVSVSFILDRSPSIEPYLQSTLWLLVGVVRFGEYKDKMISILSVDHYVPSGCAGPHEAQERMHVHPYI